VVGEEQSSDSLLVVSGGLATADSRSRRFAPLDSIGGMGFLVFDGGARVLIPAIGTNASASLSIFTLLSSASTAIDLWQIDSTGHRPVGLIDGFPQCGTPDEGKALCFVRGARSAAVWTVTPEGPEVTTRRLQLGAAHTAWIGPGAQLTALNPSNRITHVDLATDRVRVIEVELPAKGAPFEARLAAGRLATLRADSTGASLVFYRLP
jgi:hypothetical protein